jgi:hypothetical protein
MTLPRLTCALLSGIVTLALAGPVEAQTFYSYVDANGIPKWGDTLPTGTQTYKKWAVAGSSRKILATLPPTDEYTRQFDPLIERYAAADGVRADLVRAVIQVESGFDPRARSPKGARGLMQLMPATAVDLGVVNSYDPEDNIRGGVRYLRTLLDRYGNDETLALAAYNAGPEAVEKYGNAIPPYRETKDYVERVQSISPLSAAAAAAAAAAKTVPVPQGVRTLYKTIVINAEGRPVARYTDTKPTSGEYEVYSYRR